VPDAGGECGSGSGGPMKRYKDLSDLAKRDHWGWFRLYLLNPELVPVYWILMLLLGILLVCWAVTK